MKNLASYWLKGRSIYDELIFEEDDIGKYQIKLFVKVYLRVYNKRIKEELSLDKKYNYNMA